MIGLDTNVIVRYLTQDDPVQAARAAQAIEDAADRGDRLILSDVVLCELVWVLESAYGYNRSQVGDVVERILQTAQFEFDHKDQLWQAWQDYRGEGGDFADYLIGRLGHAAGCEVTLTFDAALKGSPLFRAL
ncbi:MAG: type II toxin-antitoxin system VapC family toxin [Rhodothermales bacterium]